ncbi:unnamed protein product [Pieris macdunnoughi]|uniref:Uncharacterized protein n=1 Tax=Pieris macdunnoughi TaxID=345717 RepID=A0A821QAM5_9NEOP|nr:unnamed protein product [Pieris macdunnoughi]
MLNAPAPRKGQKKASDGVRAKRDSEGRVERAGGRRRPPNRTRANRDAIFEIARARHLWIAALQCFNLLSQFREPFDLSRPSLYSRNVNGACTAN